MKNCKRCYILADASKFDQLSSVKFADFDQATILTTELYKPALKNIKYCGGERMIYTVTFNPSIDYIVNVDNFMTGVVNRTSKEIIFREAKESTFPWY